MTEKHTPVMELHPLCTYFPRMSEAEFSALKDNIQAIGQTHPIYTLDGMILDGGNRYRALCELDIEPLMTAYTGNNPTQFILSSNLHRRHLSQGQSAAIVSASQSWVKAQVSTASDLPTVLPLATAEARAKQSGVGQRTQQMADKLIKEAPAELVKEVIDGKKSLTKAIKEITPAKPVIAKPELDPVIDAAIQSSQAEASTNDQALSQLIEEQHATIQALEADKQTLKAVLEADDKLAASFDEVKALTADNQALNERIKELNTEKEAALKAADYWKAQYLELEESLDKERVD
jgi:hypothetical protein